MKAKWLIGSLFVLLILLGIGQDNTSLPNQEIVLQFNNTEVTEQEAQNTIAVVEQQLINFGAQSIHLRKQEDGKLILSYYTNVGVDHIKKLLANESDLIVGFNSDSQDNQSERPSSDSSSYNLDIYEIDQNNNLDLDNKGYVFNTKYENDWSFNPSVYVSSHVLHIKKHLVDKRRLKIYQNNASALNNTTRKIPDVRAGPIA